MLKPKKERTKRNTTEKKPVESKSNGKSTRILKIYQKIQNKKIIKLQLGTKH